MRSAACRRGGSRVRVPRPPTPCRPPTAKPAGPLPRAIVSSTRRSSASIRETVLSPLLATQTAPSPAATALGSRPTRTVSVTALRRRVHARDRAVVPVGDPERALAGRRSRSARCRRSPRRPPLFVRPSMRSDGARLLARHPDRIRGRRPPPSGLAPTWIRSVTRPRRDVHATTCGVGARWPPTRRRSRWPPPRGWLPTAKRCTTRLVSGSTCSTLAAARVRHPERAARRTRAPVGLAAHVDGRHLVALVVDPRHGAVLDVRHPH